VVDAAAEKHKIGRFDLLIDWGWFYFLTKPLFFARMILIRKPL